MGGILSTRRSKQEGNLYIELESDDLHKYITGEKLQAYSIHLKNDVGMKQSEKDSTHQNGRE